MLVRGAGTRCCAGAGMLTFLHVLAWLSVRCSVRSPALLGANKESLSQARAAQTHYCLVYYSARATILAHRRFHSEHPVLPFVGHGVRPDPTIGPDQEGPRPGPPRTVLDVILSSPSVSVPARWGLESGMRVPPSSWSVLGCGAGLKLHVFIFEDPHSTGQ